MCSIIGSYDRDELYFLVDENQTRGTVGYTISKISKEEVKVVDDGSGLLNDSIIEDVFEDDGSYYIVHLRTPTSIAAKETLYSHPTYHDGHYLWHNGLIKPKGIETLNNLLPLDLKTDFDSLALNRVISAMRVEFPSFLTQMEGLFACISIFEDRPEKLLLYRSRHATLFIDPVTYTISSVRFDGGKRIEADIVYVLDIEDKNLNIMEDKIFKTKKFNYYLEGEL